jgi:hypothetical protein
VAKTARQDIVTLMVTQTEGGASHFVE